MSAYYRADSYAVGSSERVVADESISFWVVWRRKVFDAFDFDFYVEVIEDSFQPIVAFASFVVP